MKNNFGYGYKETLWNMQEYFLSHLQQNVELVIYCALCLFAPFFLGHPQLVVGVVVNAALILAALNMKNHMLIPIILLPSVGVLSRGLIFGPFTNFLLVMMPFIWIGNFILIYAFKKLMLEKKLNRWLTLGIGAVAKTGFLFLSAFVLFKLNLLPALFLTTMGLFQLYTAVAGGVLALGIHTAKKKLIS